MKSIKGITEKAIQNMNAIKGGEADGVNLNFPLTSKAKSTARG